MDKEYNGFTNRETWTFKLHIDNNRGDYEHWEKQTKEALKKEFPKVWLSDQLKKWFEDIFYYTLDNATKSNDDARLFVEDVGNGDNVDWFDISEKMIKDAKSD